MTSTLLALPALVWTHPGNRGRRVRALGRLVAWQLWERATGRPWIITLGVTRRLRCEPHSTSASGVLYCGLPDWPEMNLMLDYLRPGDVFVDVGANVGVYSLLATVITDVDVWAFEPSSAAWASARDNLVLNQLENDVHLTQAAVGDEPGEVLLSVGLGTVNHVVPAPSVDAVEVVPLVALDAYLPVDRQEKVRMMKIDVEGNELSVLEGAKQLILRSRPIVMVEANDVDRLSAWLKELDYSPYTYLPERRELTAASWAASATGNIIAVADLGRARERLRLVQ